MISPKRTSNTFLLCLLGMMAIINSCLVIFPKLYLVLNIAGVLLLFSYYILANGGIAKVQDVLIAILAAVLIVAWQDATKISLFVAFLFWQTSTLYEKSSTKLYRNILLAAFVCVVIAYCFGFNRQYDRLNWSPSQQMYLRERPLGFINANRCMLFVFVISCMMLMGAEKVWQYLLIALANGILYQFTKSRTFLYVLLMVVGALCLLKVFKCEKTVSAFGKSIPWVYLALFAFSILLPYFFAGTRLDQIFTGRLGTNKAFLQSGITWFGNSALENTTFDSAYLHMLLTKGVVFLVLFTGIFFYCCKKATITNKGAVMLCAVLVAGFMEVIFLDSNILFLMGIAMHSGREKEENYANQEDPLLLVRRQSQV